VKGCVFCRIVAGELPAAVVYSDEHVIAFDDVSPQAPVHVLVVPREHYTHLGDGVPEQVIGALFAAVPRVAEAKGVRTTGYRTIVNTGPDAAQTIEHLHVHVMGGAPMAEGMVRFRKEG
jgi:histidine triad (HIT) family protein